MAKLNQIIAVEKGVKSKQNETVSRDYKHLQKPDLFNGFVKNYRKLSEDDPDLPKEQKRVQLTVDGVLKSIAVATSDLMNISARRDYTNCIAKADVVIDGVVILEKVPVTYLLFLEKQAVDLRTMISTIPTLSEEEDWSEDDVTGLQKSELTSTHKTKKVEEPLVLYPATEQHPAQTKMIAKDVITGYWDQYKFSGAMKAPEKAKLAEKAEKLVRAIKEAREAANNIDVVQTEDIGNKIFGYLF